VDASQIANFEVEPYHTWNFFQTIHNTGAAILH